MASLGIHWALNRLQDASDTDGLELLKLALECLELRVAQLEKIKSFSDAYNELNSHDSTADQSLPLLCAVLSEMPVPMKELNDLKKHTTEEDIEKCRQRKDFGFARMIIKLCGEFTETEFGTFRHLSLAYLDHKLNVGHCPSIVELFQTLIRARKVVWSESVEVLSDILSEMKKESSLVHVDNYKRSIGLLGNPEPAGSVNSLPSLVRDAGEGGEESGQWSSGQWSGHFNQGVSEQTQSGGPGSIVVSGHPASTQQPPEGNIHIVCGEHQIQRQLSATSAYRGTDDDVKTDGPKKQPTSTTPEPFSKSSVGVHPDLLSPEDSGNVSIQQDADSLESSLDGPECSDRHPLLSPEKHVEKDSQAHVVVHPESKSFPKQHGRTFLKRHKRKLICLFVFMKLILAASVVLIGIGVYYYKQESMLIEKNALNQTSYAVGDEIIVLGEVNADVVSTVTVEEKPEHGDSSHVNMVYLTAKDKLKKHIDNINKAYEGFYSPNPWRTTGVIDSYGTYILNTGFINFTFCSANPRESTGEATAYIFNDEKSYFKYAGQSPGSEASSYIFHKAMEVGTFNQSICVPFEYSITEPGFYFVVIDTPSSIYYNYSYEIRDVYLERNDYSVACENVYEQQPPCVIELSGKTGLYYVLAYVRPHIDLESVTTHLHASTSGLSYSVNFYMILGEVCIGVGGFLLLAFLILFVVFCVCICVK